MPPFLTRPSTAYKDSYIDAVREFQAEGRLTEYDLPTLEANFADFVQNLLDKETHPVGDRVPETIYWLVDETAFIGRIAIRHELNDFLSHYGGHIGYEVRPSKRRRGYGTLMLKLALPCAYQIGLRRVLITCDDTNIGSAKIIEANGGVLQDINQLDFRPVPTRRYWVEIEAR